MQPQQLIFGIGATLALCLSGWAQDLTVKAPPQSEPILIQGATLYTMDQGVIETGSLLFDGGRITAVEKGAIELTDKDRQKMRIIDGQGLFVYPGFICAGSVMGLTEVGSVDMTVDTREAGDLKPEVVPALAVNPDSWLIPVARLNGVLTCGVMPLGGVVSGRISAVRLDGWTCEQMTIDQTVGLMMNWPFSGGRRFGRFGRSARTPGRDSHLINRLFESAEAYHQGKEADPSMKTDVRLEAMGETLKGEDQVFINAMSQTQIEEALTWASGKGLRVVLVGARDAHLCLDMIKRHDAFVMVTGTHRLPSRRDLSVATTYELPAMLEEAGIRWCLSMPISDASNVRNLPYEAAAAVPHGLSRDVALRSITLSAAECLGLESLLGSLTTGKAATFFIADGDPFEFRTKITQAFIDGREIELTDKQVHLAAKYREKYRQMGLIPDPSDEEKNGEK